MYEVTACIRLTTTVILSFCNRMSIWWEIVPQRIYINLQLTVQTMTQMFNKYDNQQDTRAGTHTCRPTQKNIRYASRVSVFLTSGVNFPDRNIKTCGGFFFNELRAVVKGRSKNFSRLQTTQLRAYKLQSNNLSWLLGESKENRMQEHEVYSYRLGEDSVMMDCFEPGTEPSGSTECEEFLR
jgi:hypothetical protein